MKTACMWSACLSALVAMLIGGCVSHQDVQRGLEVSGNIRLFSPKLSVLKHEIRGTIDGDGQAAEQASPLFSVPLDAIGYTADPHLVATYIGKDATRAQASVRVYPSEAVDSQGWSPTGSPSFDVKLKKAVLSQLDEIRVETGLQTAGGSWQPADQVTISVVASAPPPSPGPAFEIPDTPVGFSKNPQLILTYTGAAAAMANTFVHVSPAEVVASQDWSPTGSNNYAITFNQDVLNQLSQIGVQTGIKASSGDWQVTSERSIPVASRRPMTSRVDVWSQDQVMDEFGSTFANIFWVCDVYFENRNTSTVILHGDSVQVRVRYHWAESDVKKYFGKDALDDPNILLATAHERGWQDYFDLVEPRRPLSFSDILAIFQYKRKANVRQTWIDYLRSAGEIASAASAFATGADYAKAVSLYNGVVVTEVEKLLLWDILMHATNLEARSLRNLEEIEPGGHVRKLVFLPRTGIPNILPAGDIPLYIAEVLTDRATGSATVVKREGVVSSVAEKTPSTEEEAK